MYSAASGHDIQIFLPPPPLKIPIASPGFSTPWQSRESRTLCILQVLSHPSGIKTPSLPGSPETTLPLLTNSQFPSKEMIESIDPHYRLLYPLRIIDILRYHPPGFHMMLSQWKTPTVEASAFTSRQATGFVSLGLNGISLGHTRRADHYQAHSRWADSARSHLYWCSQCSRSGSSPS